MTAVAGDAHVDDVNSLIEEARKRRARGLRGRHRTAAAVFGGAFLAAGVSLAALMPSHRPTSAIAVVLLVAAYAVTSRVRFEVRTGVAVPTQLVFVAMLFLLPVRIVPLCVAAGFVLGRSGEFARRRVPLHRSLLLLASSWHAIGPALVLGLAGESAPSWSAWPIYLAALAAQFAFDFASTATWEWLVLGVPPRSQLRFMGWAYLVDAALAPVGLLVAMTDGGHPWAVLLVLPLVGLLANFARERQIRVDHALELSSAYRGTAFLLGDVVEADDAYTGSHSRDVVTLVVGVADTLGLDVRERRIAEFAALLHDVGKIRVPAEIINKGGPLSPEEWAVMHMHTIDGERMLSRVGGLLSEVGSVIRSCHEHYDGRGYPDGLAGHEIPLIARIVCCCDAFSAMTTDRSYRAARSTDEALDELRAQRGHQFDPDVVGALIAVVGKYDALSTIARTPAA